MQVIHPLLNLKKFLLCIRTSNCSKFGKNQTTEIWRYKSSQTCLRCFFVFGILIFLVKVSCQYRICFWNFQKYKTKKEQKENILKNIFRLDQVISYESMNTLHKKWSFPWRISSVNVTKSAIFCEFDHIYWRNR